MSWLWLPLLSLLSTVPLLVLLTRSLWHSALRSACLWAWFQLIALVGSSFIQIQFGSIEQGVSGLSRVFSVATALMPAVAVMGARWPGSKSWNLIVVSLLAVYSLPILEQTVLQGSFEFDRVAMDGPRCLFFWLVGMVGLVNYLVTRYGPAALCWGLGLLASSLAVGPWGLETDWVQRLDAVSRCLFAATIWTGWLLSRRRLRPWLDGGWMRFRDSWGLVWASRFRERWNAEARQRGWSMRLSWYGLELRTQPGSAEIQAAEAQFRFLLKRYVRPEDYIRGSWEDVNQQA